MPRIKRWFHVSHDINSDPEVWELTETFGDRGLRAWLEILSIADRNEGFIPTADERLVRALSIKLNTVQTKTRNLLRWFEDRTWLVRSEHETGTRTARGTNDEGTSSNQGNVLRVRNYVIYNPSRDAKGKQTVSPPNHPNPPIRTKPSKKHKNASSPPPSAEAIECAQLLSDRIFENFPNRTAPTEAQLTSWAHEADKLNRLDSHSWAEIRDVLEWSQQDDFWRRNILSIPALRKKWNQLIARKEKSNATHEPKGLAALEEWRRLKLRGLKPG